MQRILGGTKFICEQIEKHDGRFVLKERGRRRRRAHVVAGVNNESPFWPVSRLRRSKIGGKDRGPTYRPWSGPAIGREISVKIVDREDLDHDVLTLDGLSDGGDRFRWNIRAGLQPQDQARGKQEYS